MQYSLFQDEEVIKEAEKLRMVTISFTGHRPNKLGGYNMKNPTMLLLKEKLLLLLEELIVNQNMSRFISGGALGFDQASFWCVHILKKKYPHIQNIVAIPFEYQDKVWTPEQKEWYKKMLAVADEIIDVSRLPEYDTKESPHLPYEEYSSKKMQKRNEYMVDHSHIVIACYDGTSGGTGNCVRYAKSAEGIHAIIQLNPKNNFEQSIL